VNGGRPYLLFTGRLERIKGAQVIIPVLRETPDVDLLIAGAGEFEADLRAMAAGATNIKFLGRVDHSQLQVLYRNALATVVPSLCYETFGLIVAESFSARTPVIVYAQSSLAELVETHGGGLTYRTVDELRVAIARLSADPSLRERLGREGRAAYEAEFAEDAFLNHYLDVTRALLARKRAGERGTDVRPSGAQLLAGRALFEA
jgi:glycosyltransferase involved in cell wall biosynthesis